MASVRVRPRWAYQASLHRGTHQFRFDMMGSRAWFERTYHFSHSPITSCVFPIGRSITPSTSPSAQRVSAPTVPQVHPRASGYVTYPYSAYTSHTASTAPPPEDARSPSGGSSSPYSRHGRRRDLRVVVSGQSALSGAGSYGNTHLQSPTCCEK